MAGMCRVALSKSLSFPAGTWGDTLSSGRSSSSTVTLVTLGGCRTRRAHASHVCPRVAWLLSPGPEHCWALSDGAGSVLGCTRSCSASGVPQPSLGPRDHATGLAATTSRPPRWGFSRGHSAFKGPQNSHASRRTEVAAQPAAVWTLPPVPGRPVGPTGEGGAGPPSLPCSSSSSLPCSFPSSARARLISVRPSALGASDFSQRPQLTPRTRAAEADGGASGCAVPLAAPRDGSLSPPGR